MKLLLTDVEIQGEEQNFNVYFALDTQKFHCFSVNSTKVLIFKLVDTIENIEKNHREEILEYCLGSFTKEDIVGIGDIFLHGKYIKKLEIIDNRTLIREHLEKLEENGEWIALSLRPPIGSNIIEDEGNRMYINEGRLGEFENVPEKFYDEMVVLFDSRYKDRN